MYVVGMSPAMLGHVGPADIDPLPTSLDLLPVPRDERHAKIGGDCNVDCVCSAEPKISSELRGERGNLFIDRNEIKMGQGAHLLNRCVPLYRIASLPRYGAGNLTQEQQWRDEHRPGVEMLLQPGRADLVKYIA